MIGRCKTGDRGEAPELAYPGAAAGGGRASGGRARYGEEGELNGPDPAESARRIAEFTSSHRDTQPALAQLAQHGQRCADHLFDMHLHILISGVAALAQGSIAAP